MSRRREDPGELAARLICGSKALRRPALRARIRLWLHCVVRFWFHRPAAVTLPFPARIYLGCRHCNYYPEPKS